MPITDASVEEQLLVDGTLARILDDQTRDLVRAWALAWDEVAPDLRDVLEDILRDYDEGERVPRSAFARAERLSVVLAIISDQLDRLASDFGIRVVRDLPTVVAAAADAQRLILIPQLPDGFRFPAGMRVEQAPLDAIVKRATQRITSPRWRLSDRAYDAVRRELVRGVAAGSGPREVAARMVKRSEDGFNGGLSRALGIARTEVLDAHRSAAKYGQDRHARVLAGWTWLAHLTPTTCRSCIAQHGSFHELSEAGPIDHQQGRCSRLPTVKPWDELGYAEQVEPEPSGMVDGEEWFAGQPESVQRDILGPRGWAAWRRGEYPMSDWSRRRSTDGWRDSMVPSVAPGA